jgi:hypothetical protein
MFKTDQARTAPTRLPRGRRSGGSRRVRGSSGDECPRRRPGSDPSAQVPYGVIPLLPRASLGVDVGHGRLPPGCHRAERAELSRAVDIALWHEVIRTISACPA